MRAIRELAAFPFRVLHKACIVVGCIFGFASFLCALAYIGIEGEK